MDTASEKLISKGFKPKFSETDDTSVKPSSREFEVKTEWHINSIVKRNIAKIAFNYLAHWEGRGFVLNEKFGPIRNFIKRNTEPSYEVVRIDGKPILIDEPKGGQRRLGHIVTVNWASDNTSIVAQVSLFNMIRYRVSLARDYTALHRPFEIAKGHFFDVSSREILELGHS